MKFTIIVTDTAKRDFRNIAVRIAELACDINIGMNFVDKITEQCQILKDFPYSGSFPQDDELRAYGYRFVIYGEYLVFYTVDEQAKNVYIMSAFSAKEDYNRIMREFMRK